MMITKLFEGTKSKPYLVLRPSSSKTSEYTSSEWYTEICVTTQETVLSMLATSLLDSTTNGVETSVCVCQYWCPLAMILRSSQR
jgi:hypothetical protein